MGWGGGSGRHDDPNGDDAGKVGGDHILYFLLTTSWLEINGLAEQSVVHVCAGSCYQRSRGD